MSALASRFLSLELLHAFERSPERTVLHRLPAVTERLLVSPWPISVLPLILAAIGLIWASVSIRRAPTTGYHTAALIAVALSYAAIMILAMSTIAFVLLPRALGSI